MKRKTLTLLFLRRDDEILLAMKKEGFGAGRWNGVGGKVEEGESIEEALVRESQEEITVIPFNHEKVADIRFDEYLKGERTLMHVHVFTASDWTGEPTETDEMAPKWFKIDDIPYETMWPDDPYWLPLVLQGKKVSADFQLNEKDDIISHTIKTVKKL